MNYELGIIGAGNMAEAIVRGLLSSGRLKPSQIIAADSAPARCDLFASFGVNTTNDNAIAACHSRTLLLSIKPQQMSAALSGLSQLLNPQTLIISIMAGISTTKIEQALGGATPWRVIRSMPNTPMLVGEGMVAIAPGQYATPADLQSAKNIFASAASVIEVTEPQIDAVTAVSGSGPAYFFYLVEQMIRAGVELGLSPDQSRQLAIKTASGAAKMLQTLPDSPQELRRKVTSPNGTTHAAITHMENNSMGTIISDALKAAAKRSKELGA